MRLYLLAGSTFLILHATVAAAASVTFSYTGSVMAYTVPSAGLYQILAYGAAGEVSPLLIRPAALK